MGKVKGASNVFGLSNWKNGVPVTEKVKTSGGTGERIGHVMLGMPIHLQSEDFKVGSWLHRLELGYMFWAGGTYLRVTILSMVFKAPRLNEII